MEASIYVPKYGIATVSSLSKSFFDFTLVCFMDEPFEHIKCEYR